MEDNIFKLETAPLTQKYTDTLMQKCELSKFMYSKYNDEFKRAVINVHACHLLNVIKDKSNINKAEFFIEFIDWEIKKALKISYEHNKEVPIPSPITEEMIQTLPKKVILQKKTEQLVTSNSFVFLIDMKGINMSHTTKYLTSFTRKALQILPLRNEDKMFRCIVLNPPSIFKFIFSICSPFIEKDTKEKIIIISNRKKDKNKKMDIMKYLENDDSELTINKKIRV